MAPTSSPLVTLCIAASGVFPDTMCKIGDMGFAFAKMSPYLTNSSNALGSPSSLFRIPIKFEWLIPVAVLKALALALVSISCD